jgi:hypothetical protein
VQRARQVCTWPAAAARVPHSSRAASACNPTSQPQLPVRPAGVKGSQHRARCVRQAGAAVLQGCEDELRQSGQRVTSRSVLC